MRRTALFIILLCFVARQLHAAPGANVPWITYEAENMAINGATVIGPPSQYANINSAVTDSIQMESSGGKAVQLTGTGQYVELTATASATALVLRYCVPDVAAGGGTNYTLSLYTNGVFAQKLTLTSKYSWLYGAYPWTNTPGAGSRDFYDELRLLGLNVNANDTVRLQRDADDTAPYYVVDLVDLENVPAALSQPAGSLSVTTYGAIADGVTDCTTTIRNCINDASSQGKVAWIPPGTYLITGNINLPSNTTLQGAGMWYSKLIGSAGLYGTQSRRINFNGSGSNIHLADFSMLGFLNYRNDSEGNDGLGGSFGTGSTIARLWIEHTKTAAWLVNASGLVMSDCRFRNTIADGVNFNTGMRACVITNCTTRNTGDDCFAMWPSTNGAQTYAPGLNVFTHCTGHLPWLSSGAAIYGGMSNRVEDCLFKDTPFGAGILVSGTFPVGPNIFSGTTFVQRCDLDRCGGYQSGWPWRAAVTLCPQYLNITNVNLNHLNISNSLSYALHIVSPGSTTTTGVLTNASMDSINISNFGQEVQPYPAPNGVYAVRAESTAVGNLKISNLTVNGVAITNLPASSAAMNNASVGSPQRFTFTFLPVPTLTLTNTGNNLQIFWPASFLGWTLQTQTNSAGLSNNWSNVPGSPATNKVLISAPSSAESRFFRLIDL